MYTKEQYEKRIMELKPLADEMLKTKTPDEVRRTVSGMSPDDAYILGMWLGKMVTIYEINNSLPGMVIAVVEKQMSGIEKRKISNEFCLN